MNFAKDNKKILIIIILLGFISLILSAYIGEDALGGAQNDYLVHEKYIISFSENFNLAIKEFGNNYEVRNSPVFYILFSQRLVKVLPVQTMIYSNLRNQ